MEAVEIEIERRTTLGKNAARRLRVTGKVPAILYGPKRRPELIAVSAAEFDRRVSHLEGAHLIRLQSADVGNATVLLREALRHPVTNKLLHVDFYEVDLTERIRVEIALHFVGKPVGVVAGGILQPVLRAIEVECLPTEIPEFAEVDVSALNIHDTIHIEHIALPSGVKAVGDPTTTVVTVVPPSVEATPAAATDAAAPAAAAAPADAAAKKPADS